MKNSIQIKNGEIVTPTGIVKGNIVIEKGCITQITSQVPATKADMCIDAQDRFILPGFIDIHTNGIAGFDLTSGKYDLKTGMFYSDEETYLKSLNQALRHYTQTGVTRVVLTSLAAPLGQLKNIFRYISHYKHTIGKTPWKNVLGGLYVEGTFMKLKDYRGAHNTEYFHSPSIDLFNELQNACNGLIKVVNIVPEWEDSALELIEYLTAQKIVCAAGHTGASGIQYEKAIKHGLRLAVHFLNGPTGSSSKSLDGGGAVETVLRMDEMYVEIIVDGYHVDKSYVLDTIKRKGFEKVIAITDSMFAAKMDSLNDFEIFGVKGQASLSGDYLQIADRPTALFGSILTMEKAFSNILTWFTRPIEGVWYKIHSPLEFEEALVKTSALCSVNPAKILGIYDSKDKTGSIEIGKSADIMIAKITQNEQGYQLTPQKVIVKGQLTE